MNRERPCFLVYLCIVLTSLGLFGKEDKKSTRRPCAIDPSLLHVLSDWDILVLGWNSDRPSSSPISSLEFHPRAKNEYRVLVLLFQLFHVLLFRSQKMNVVIKFKVMDLHVYVTASYSSVSLLKLPHETLS